MKNSPGETVDIGKEEVKREGKAVYIGRRKNDARRGRETNGRDI